jgi:Spy/CpxP family protein refolding chaperone
MNKKTVLRGVVCFGVGLLLFTPVLPGRAAAKAVPQTEAQGHPGMRGDALQEAVNGLDLNDDQKAKVKDIFTDAKTKREAIFKDSSLNQDQKKEKMKGLRQETVGKLNEVLTPDQQAQLKQKMEAAKAAKQAQ